MNPTELVLRTVLIILAAGLIVAAWLLMFQGQRSPALTILAVESVLMIIYWWRYLRQQADRPEERENQH